MRALVMIFLSLAAVAVAAVPSPPAPESVAVLFNAAVPESRKLAAEYQQARGIPAGNLVGLEMPVVADISREEYDRFLMRPLRAEFEKRGWWKRGRDAGGLLVPVSNRIRVMVSMKGVPLRIRQTPPPPPPAQPKEKQNPAQAAPPQDPFGGHDEASVDSELAMFGIEGLPTSGTLQNKYYQSNQEIGRAELPFLVLTARIDASRYEVCSRMIRDAVETSKTGLWGMAYVDIANKFPQGDQWLETVVKENQKTGIPTVVDRFNDTLPKHYPMNEASLYYGWYDWNISGPFLNPAFRFRKGAVAMHLHSFSAQQLTDPNQNWSAGLLERGAAVTIGNVYEPYLHLTHDFGLLHQRLLAGYSWVEACWMAMPAASWQGVVLGDPLYQPFRHLDGGGERAKEDLDYRALRMAMVTWPGDAAGRRKQLEAAGERLSSGIYQEAAGLDCLQAGLTDEAATRFLAAKARYVKASDKLRQDFHRIAIDRAAGRKDLAVKGLREAMSQYAAIPEIEAFKGWLDILDPPPPPQANPNKAPAVQTPKQP